HAAGRDRRVEDGIVVASYHAIKTELLNHTVWALVKPRGADPLRRATPYPGRARVVSKCLDRRAKGNRQHVMKARGPSLRATSKGEKRRSCSRSFEGPSRRAH